MSESSQTSEGVQFSCVIPAYNREGTVERAIRSALGQTHPPAEILVVDDGSSDRTAELAGEFGGIVKVIRRENGGASAARNRGAAEAQHEWLAWLDSDDEWKEHHLDRIAAAITATEGRAGIYFGDIYIDPGSREGGSMLWDRYGFSIGNVPFRMFENGEEVVFPSVPLYLQCSVFRKDSFEALGGLREDLKVREDTHLIMMIALKYPVCAVRVHSTDMYSDAGDRLSAERGLVYWEHSRTVWAQVKDRYTHLRDANRRLVRKRLAMAHLRYGRELFRQRRFLAGACSVARATATDLGFVLRSLRSG